LSETEQEYSRTSLIQWLFPLKQCEEIINRRYYFLTAPIYVPGFVKYFQLTIKGTKGSFFKWDYFPVLISVGVPSSDCPPKSLSLNWFLFILNCLSSFSQKLLKETLQTFPSRSGRPTALVLLCSSCP